MISSNQVTLPSSFPNKGTKTYYAFGLILLVLAQICYVQLPTAINSSSAVSAIGFAALARLLAAVQSTLPLPATTRALLPWSYGLGTILTLTNWPWLHNVLATAVRDPDWVLRVGVLDLLFPALILLTVGTLLIGVLAGKTNHRGRGYLIAGLCLAALSIGKLWLNLFRIHFDQMPDTSTFLAGLLWMPASLIVAAAGILLGSFPSTAYNPSRLGSVLTLSYILGVILIPFGYYAGSTNQESSSYAVLLLVTLTVLVPASYITRRWINARSVTGKPEVSLPLQANGPHPQRRYTPPKRNFR